MEYPLNERTTETVEVSVTMSQVELDLSHTGSFNNAHNIQHIFIICLNANSFKWVPVKLFKLAHDASYNNRYNSLNIETTFLKLPLH